MSRLDAVEYMGFPFTIGQNGAHTSKRIAHIKEQIEQVLFTSPDERIFRSDFGAGINRLIFEPNNVALQEATRKRLYSSLVEALKGEVDPKSLNVLLERDNEKLYVVVEYTLAALNHSERQEILINLPG